ncbi:MAG: SH3 domain-containing protein [Clostridia bacterium]|nr:SH3 domain-containing protein [Clostridia bacterium]
MKKRFVTLLAFVLALGLTVAGASAENWFFTSTQGQSYDDVQIGVAVSMGQKGSATVTGFSFKDQIGFYQAGAHSVGSAQDYYLSGSDADFAVLKMDITNGEGTQVDYLANCKVQVSDGTNTYGGWAFQQNPDNASAMDISYGFDSGVQNQNWVINAADNHAIAPAAQGHYMFGCTLPNAVVNATGLLKMTVTVRDSSFVYYIRRATQATATPAATLPPFAPVATQAPVQQSQSAKYVYGQSGDSHVRTGPGLSYTSLGVLKKGSGANYLNESSVDNRGVAWYKISYKGNTAWVSSRYTVLRDGSWGGGAATPTSAPRASGYVEGTSGKSHVRTGPGLSYDDVGVLHVGETATYLGEQSTDSRGVVWYKISYKGKTRWVSSKYTTLH